MDLHPPSLFHFLASLMRLLQSFIIIVLVAFLAQCRPTAAAQLRPEMTTQPITYEPLPTSGPLTAAQIGSGVHYDLEFNETSVTTAMHNLHSWGFRNVIINVYADGHTLHPSSALPQRDNARDRDWLQFAIESAAQHNVRVIAALDILAAATTSTLAQVPAPSLAATSDGTTTSSSDGRMYVLPTAPGLQDTLTTLVRELAAYDIAGIHLEHLHYNPDADTGYSPEYLQEFREANGTPAPRSRTSRQYPQWVQLRADKLTSLTQHLSAEIREGGTARGKRLLVSASLLMEGDPDIPNYGFQNWREWIVQEYIDFSTPLCLAPGLHLIERQMRDARSVHQGRSVACVPTLLLGPRSPGYVEQRRLLESVGFRNCNFRSYLELSAEIAALLRDEIDPPADDEPTTPGALQRWLPWGSRD